MQCNERKKRTPFDLILHFFDNTHRLQFLQCTEYLIQCFHGHNKRMEDQLPYRITTILHIYEQKHQHLLHMWEINALAIIWRNYTGWYINIYLCYIMPAEYIIHYYHYFIILFDILQGGPINRIVSKSVQLLYMMT